MTEYEHISRWTLPKHYIGERWDEYYSAGVGQHRNSAPLERANFDAMIRLLDGESDTVIIVREDHWAVGWVEWIAIHESDGKALACADTTHSELADYPVLDDELFSAYEDDDAGTVWRDCMDWAERIEYIRKDRFCRFGCAEPESQFLLLLAAVRGSWDAARGVLDNPVEIIY